MIDTPPVSIIVPIYNVKKFVAKCVKSLLKQTYDNYEIILVDDGSTDGSEDICDELADYSDIVKTYHKKNGGLSDARNFGVRVAKYESIIFVDSDDYVDPEYVDYLVGLKKKYKSEIAVSGFFDENINGVIKRKNASSNEFVCSSEKAFRLICYGKAIPIMAWGKIYTRSLLIKFPFPIGVLNEDVGTTYKLILAASKIAVGDRAYYHYISRPGSILHSNNKDRAFYGVKAAKEIVDFAESELHEGRSIKAAYARLAIESIGLLHRSVKDKTTYHKSTLFIRESFEHHFCFAIFNTKLSLSKRMQLVLFVFNGNLYRLVYLISRGIRGNI